MQQQVRPSPASGAPKGATIKDVAREAGVSITTVSNVLNGRTGAMSAETLGRVNAVMNSLAYCPSSVARSLVTGRVASIAVVLAGGGSSGLFRAVAAIERCASEGGYGISLVIGKDGGSGGRPAGMRGDRQSAGLVIASSSMSDFDDGLLPLLESAAPVVLLNGSPAGPERVQVAWDEAGGVASAVAHLVGLGHRRIAFLTDTAESENSEARRQAYLGAMADHGLRPHDEWMKACSIEAPRDKWRRTLTELASAPPRPTAALAATDAIAAVAMRELQRLGVRVPGDFAVVGMGGSDFCSLLSPALTTMRLPFEEAGRCAAEMLLEMIAGGQSGGQRVALPCSLIVRDSCGTGLRPAGVGADKPIQQRPLW
jgi:LacI family transcriptional regulator